MANTSTGTEQWLFATDNLNVLTQWGLPPAQVPGTTLLNQMFGPSTDDIQTGPLFNPVEFAVEAYRNGAQTTIHVTHVQGTEQNNNFCQSS